jgi:hypothetical protein
MRLASVTSKLEVRSTASATRGSLMPAAMNFTRLELLGYWVIGLLGY